MRQHTAPLLFLLLFATRAFAEDFASEARRQCTEGSPDQAIVGCTTLIQSIADSPTDRAVSFNNRGIAYAKKRDLPRAIADFSEAIRLNGDFALAFNNRATAYRSSGRDDLALADFTEAIRLSPDYADAYYGRAGVKAKKGDLDGAIADYSAAIRLKPGNNTAYVDRGAAYAKKGLFEQSIADFDTGIRLDPNDAIAFRNRGYVKQMNGDIAGGNSDLLRARQLGSPGATNKP